jgi:hypothetical protein
MSRTDHRCAWSPGEQLRHNPLQIMNFLCRPSDGAA